MTEYLEKINETEQESIAYVDETGIDEYMYRERAWSLKGTKVRDKISGRKYRRTGLAAALCRGKITAPMQYSTMDSELSYAPELNPTERYWATLKKRLRGVMEYMPSLDDAICCCLWVK